MCEGRKCAEWHVVAILLVSSYYILHKLPEVDGCTFPRKPVAPCCKTFQASLSLSLRARSNWEYRKIWRICGPANKTVLILSILCFGNYWHKNENARPFLSSVLTKFFIRPNLRCRVWSNILHRSTKCWWTTFLVPDVFVWRKGQFFWRG